MKKNLFLHIGFNKTGSSYIQNCLALNSQKLKKYDYCYPSKPGSSYIQNNQHVPLAAAISGTSFYWLNNKKKDVLYLSLSEFLSDAQQSGVNNVIVSSEAFGDINVGSAQIEQIISCLSDFEIHVIAYVRRQDEYMLSAYQQDVKTGATMPFNLETRLNLEQNHFLKRLEPWKRLLGADRVTVREYDRTQWTDGDLFLDFLHAIGIPSADWKLAESVNEGLDHREVSLIMQLNSHLKGDFPGKRFLQARNQIRNTVLQAIRSIDPLEGGHQKLRLSDFEIQQIADFFMDENKKLLGPERGEKFITFSSNGEAGNTDHTELDHDLMLKIIIALSKRVIRLQRKAR